MLKRKLNNRLSKISYLNILNGITMSLKHECMNANHECKEGYIFKLCQDVCFQKCTFSGPVEL